MTTKSETVENALAGLRDPHAEPGVLLGHLSFLVKATRSVHDVETEISASLAAGHAARTLFHHKDRQLLHACLTLLLQCGKTGRSIVRRHIQTHSIAKQELISTTKKLSPSHRLLLAHEFLRKLDFMEDKSLVQWLEELTRSLQHADFKRLFMGLAILGREGDLLAYPVKEALLEGGLAAWLQKHLSAPLNARESETVASALATLRERDLSRLAYAGLTSGHIHPDRHLVLTLASHVAPEDNELPGVLQAIIKRTGFESATDCLDGFLRMGWPRSGEMLALMFSRQPEHLDAFAARASLLTGYDLGVLLRKLPSTDKKTFLARFFTALAAMSPAFLNAHLKGESEEALMYAAQLKAFVTENAFRLVDVHQMPRPVCAIPSPEESKPGFMQRFLGDKTKALEKLLAKGARISGQDLPGSILRRSDLKRKDIKGCGLRDVIFDETSFYEIRFRGCDLRGSQFRKSRFTNCTFENCRLDAACFERASFTNCRFRFGSATETTLTSCTLLHCTFDGMLMHKARFVGTVMEQCVWNQCILPKSHWQEARSDRCIFTETDFSHTELLALVVEGCEFTDCTFNGSGMVDCRFPGTSFRHCTARKCKMRGVETDHHFLLRTRLDWLFDAPHALTGTKLKPPTTALQKDVSPILRRIAIRWVRHLEFARRESRMLADNCKRYQRALSILEPEQRDFIRLLPYLLHTDTFEQKLGISNVPACTVSNYVPGATTLHLAKELLPGLEPGNDVPVMEITALYTMGSYGSVAQTGKSDIDCWVCIKSDTATPDNMHGLIKKLDALTLWADLQFGLEAHFFPMSEDKIRKNDFGYSDKESSGSAQAILLKEEFYRSALKLAGKSLAWWLTPAGADGKTYANHTHEALAYPLPGPQRIIDLGPLAAIPPGEFFGASLWQIAKALHSPFKSVMKLGLLERYSGFGTTGGIPLCDTIKANLFDGLEDIRHTDSYATLYQELHRYYSEQEDSNAMALLAESFVAKADFNQITMFLDRPASDDGKRMIEIIFGERTASATAAIPEKSVWNFSKALKMGNAVRRFMTATYKRIQEELSSGGSAASALITPEDRTRLGRRISANFARKNHKVTRVPFMDVGDNTFSTIHFSAAKKPGKQTIWMVQGSQKSEAKSSVRQMQVLHKEHDPAMLLSWLFFNGLYNPNVLLQADRTVAPLAVTDIQKLLTAMREFFPLEKTFERDIDEGLRPERITRAFFLLNLTAPHDQKKLTQATVIYATTWGEVFCETHDNPDPIIEKHASAFLHKVMKRPLRDSLDMTAFIPKGSQCARIKLI